MFKLSRRKGSAKWQIRKRWPSDVAAILKGEFNASTGEEDKRKAELGIPFLSAAYYQRVQEARDKLAEQPKVDLSEREALAMAAEFYRTSLPSYSVTNVLSPEQHRELLREAKDRLAAAQAALGRNDHWAVVAVARTMAKRAGLTVGEDDPAMDLLRANLMAAFVELQRGVVAKLEGSTYTPSSALLDPPSDAEKPAQRTVEDLITAYEAAKSPGWSGSTKKAVKPVFRFLREVFPNVPLADLNREEARRAMDLLSRLPKLIGKQKALDGLTVPAAIEKASKLALPTISPKTVNDGYLLHISSMFNWARREQWVAANPFEGLTVFDPVSDEDRRDPFTVPQLSKLFSTAPWERPWAGEDKKAGSFWVPLLCLFHGLRNGEAAGLRVEDIDEEDGVPVLHIRAYNERRLKTAGSRGALPIHPELLCMGFQAYVKGRRSAGEMLLFPEGVVNGRGQVAAKLSERFSDKVKALGFEGRKLGMHSFRHNFEDRLRAAELPERTALALARRTEAGSSRIYGDGLSARQKAEALGRIAYPGLDLSHLHVKKAAR